MAESDLPTSALEDWRYSRIDSFDLDRWAPARGDRAVPGPRDPVVAGLLAACPGEVTVVETVDGRVQRWPEAAGVSVSGAPPEPPPPCEAGDAFALLNQAFAPEPLTVSVPGGKAAGTLVILHWCAEEGVAVFPRVCVDAGADSEISVVEVVAGPGRCLVVPVTDITIGAAARVRYTHVQLLSEQSWQVGMQSSSVSRDATFTSGAVALGGHYARMRTDSSLVGPGGTTRLLAAYFGAGEQMHDFRTTQAHIAEKARSDLLYKGVVANRSRSVYSGLIRVEKGARGTNAFQTNRNLVLHEGAHADSVPNLEIEDNDVRCSHASAVGPIAADERFYLESRGVPPQVAERLIALGFMAQVVSQLPQFVAGAVTDALVAKLASAEAIEDSGVPA